MKQSKKNQKKTVKVNQKQSSSDNLKTHLLWRAKQLFILHRRLSKCILALNQHGDVPDDIAMNAIANKYLSLKIDFEKDIKKHGTSKILGINNFEDILSIADDAIKNRINNPRILQSLRYACLCLSLFYTSNYQDMEIQDIKKYTAIENLLNGKSHEAIGYWTAKLEIMKTNKEHGAKAMQDKGDKNKEAIRQIIKEQNITSMDFRGDKSKRESFYETAKKRTKEIDTKNKTALTESRIQKIGRQILKEDKPLI